MEHRVELLGKPRERGRKRMSCGPKYGSADLHGSAGDDQNFGLR